MKIYFYKRAKGKIIAVESRELNELARAKLEKLFASRDEHNIPSRYIRNWSKVAIYEPSGEIEKANSILINPSDGAYSLKNKLNDLTGKEWIKFTKSWFVFDAIASDLREEKEVTQQLGLRSEDHPATFSPTMISEFVLFFTKEGDYVLDPFCGIGTTLVACDRTKRKGIGIELNPKYVEITKLRTKQTVIKEDSSKLLNIWEEHNLSEISFSISSPPYWDILNRSTGDFKKTRDLKSLDIRYSDNMKQDIGNIKDYNLFVDKTVSIYLQLHKILKCGGYLVIIVKNIKKEGKKYPLAWDLSAELSKKYELKDEKIWCQSKVGLSPFGYPYSWTSNIVHHYCLIFQKTK
ncbi:MAG TPA: DNA methyltransferase [Candidatus Glassbacteria bacterium]|nr:DNA methyltransferase [Candidatus Glassbacteria bacterium]